MAKYRKKPVVIDAEQWFKNGDNPLVKSFSEAPYILVDTSHWDGFLCVHCHQQAEHHGWIGTLEGGHIVCPGDWIITGVEGERYPCKPTIFEKTYELVKKDKPVQQPDARDWPGYRYE